MTKSPDISELHLTCERMEKTYLASPNINASYQRLVERFSADLPDERDKLLSRCAALMMIKFLSENDAL